MKIRPRYRLASMAVAVAGGLFFGARIFGLVINLSGSMPIGIYRRTKGEPIRHSLVLVQLPPLASRYTSDPLLKEIVAIAGDHVTIDGRGISVNGVLLSNTAPKETDSNGLSLPQIRLSDYYLKSGEIVIASRYSVDSCDARYFGVTAYTAILSTVVPLLTTKDYERIN